MLDLGKNENFTIYGHGLNDIYETLPDENKNGFFIQPTGFEYDSQTMTHSQLRLDHSLEKCLQMFQMIIPCSEMKYLDQ